MTSWLAAKSIILTSTGYVSKLENPPVPDKMIEISKGFASYFTGDSYLQNIIAAVLSPLFFIFLVACVLWIAYRIFHRYNDKIKSDISQGQQLLLFKARQMGLNDYQFKILKGITDILVLPKPSIIADQPALFEKSIVKFLDFASGMGESQLSLEAICRDLVITYEKLYHHTEIRKPLSRLPDLEINTMMSIDTEAGNRFTGKLRSTEKNNFSLQVFMKQEDISTLKPGLGMSLYFWRAGDAEYSFSSIIVGVKGPVIDILNTGEFVRGQSVPHPLIDMVMPCSLSVASETSGEESVIETDIFKMNEFEVLIRCKEKLRHDKKYTLHFTVSDFTIATDVQILRERYISDRHIFYFSLKFVGLSDAARTVISNFINDHLFQ